MTTYRWGSRSMRHRSQLHLDLLRLVDDVLLHAPFDCSLTDSHRGQEAQNAAFAAGSSKLRWPESKHNQQPSLAVHIDPYPINYERPLRYYVLAGVVLSSAKALDISIRWGGDWDMDTNYAEETFRDLAHWELVGEMT